MARKIGKYNQKIVDRIVALTKTDTFTVTEICAQVGITPKTYFKWMLDHPDFEEAVEDAKDELMESMVLEAKKSLRKKITGYDVKETRVETIPSGKLDANGNPTPKIKKQITTTKHIAADTAALIFTLTNGDPNHWRNRQTTEVTGKDGKDLLQMKTDDELNAEIEELMRKLY